MGHAPVLIVINNDGYTIGRAIHRPAAIYHDIPAWDWVLLPATVAPTSSTFALRVASRHELDQSLAWASHVSDGPALVELLQNAKRTRDAVGS